MDQKNSLKNTLYKRVERATKARLEFELEVEKWREFLYLAQYNIFLPFLFILKRAVTIYLRCCGSFIRVFKSDTQGIDQVLQYNCLILGLNLPKKCKKGKH